MRVIFLDLDGVLNTFSHFSSTGDFSKSACKHLKDLLGKVSDLMIVVSSSYRLHGLDACKAILDKNGIDPKRVIDITDDIKEDGTNDRGYHIKKWLDRHPKVFSFVIIDDESDMDDLMNKLVKTNSFIGITKKDIDLALEILNKNNKL